MNIAIINQGCVRYLFEVPENITLKEGEKVKCDTRRGITDGIVWADSIAVDEPAAKLIGKLLGAKFPLKSVVGKTVTSVEMFEQPKREPVKLYCVEAEEGYLTKGKIYELDADGRLVYDCCETAERYKTVDAFFRDYSNWKACLVPLVSRPAKVGEWVYICDATPNRGQTYKNGDVFKITHMHKTFSHNVCNDQQGDWFEDEEYLVLDGYKPEPEYLNMKVVCVANNTSRWFTTGKVYEVRNGVLNDDDGKFDYNPNSPAKTLEQLNVEQVPKFVEFKGE